jgi:hypothetical protein
MPDRSFLFRWVRATWVGWLLGVPLIIALALIGEVMGVGGAQWLVGAGIGAGVGLAQGRTILPILGRSGPWFWSCVGGVSAPFLGWDLAKAAGWHSPYSPYVALGLGGFLAGAWQAALLRDRFGSPSWWVAASALGWTLAGGTAAIADWLSRSQSFRGIWGALAYLAIVAAGGLMLGLVTGTALVRNRRPGPLA